LLAHPRLDLYVDVDSKHSFESIGCTSCHGGSGQETDFVLTAHVPRDIWVDEKTGQPVLPEQLEGGAAKHGEHHAPDLSNMLAAVYPHDAVVPEKVSDLHIELPENHDAESHVDPNAPVSYVDPATGNESRAVRQMAYWIKKYEPEAPRSFALVYHEWDWPMKPFKYMQANCTRCHTDVYDIREEAPIVNEGRVLFTQMGCVNCHQMDSIPADQNRKVGTDLRHVTSKLSPAFINTWIWAPKAFRPSTKMPHFFMLENNSSDEELRRTRQEARAITEYLVRTATPQLIRAEIPSGMKGSAEAGQKVFNSIGCLGCHTNLNEVGEKWITTDLNKRLGIKPADAKAMYQTMTYNERQLYVYENLAEKGGSGGGDVPRYDDGTSTKPGTPKPIFVSHGPELSGIGTKLLAGRTEAEARDFLFNWVRNPRHYSDYTVMPDLRLTDQQAMDLVEYLLAQKRTVQSKDDPWTAELTPIDTPKLIELTSFFLRSQFSPNVATQKADDLPMLRQLAIDAWPDSQTDPETANAAIDAMGDDKDTLRLFFLGKKLISHYGCMSCHAINGTETISSPCANLSDWGQKRITQIAFEFLDHHKVQGLPPTSQIPMVNGLSAEAADLVHTLPGDGGWASPIAAPVEAAWPHVEHDRVAWLTQKLRNTRVYDRGRNLLEPKREFDPATGKARLDAEGHPIIADGGKPYDKLKMPTFYLSDDQIDAIVTFVISNRDPLVSERMIARTNTEQSQRIARGRAITEKFNCVGCHQVEMNTPPVQQHYERTEIATKAPPSLRGEGNKIQHAWRFNFLKNVHPIRPLPVIHMPSFPLTDEETTAIASYFNAVSVRESQKLVALLDPVTKYIEAQEEAASAATTQPTTRPANAIWPGDDWYEQPSFAPAAERLRQWALARDQISPVQLNPALNKPEELARNYRQLLFKAHFTGELYEAPYPFVEQSHPQFDEERFKKGEQFFYDMQCLKCHVLGDPGAPGATKAPTAPNLGLAHERLQRRWVRHWVQEPPIIQAGTAMPPFFTGLPVFSLIGQTWPKSQGAAPAEAERVEAKYGDTVEEQTNLLLDFLFAAGDRGYTGVQPPATTQPAQ
jgi:cytochrome c551/c552